jgi:hypothetical protein
MVTMITTNVHFHESYLEGGVAITHCNGQWS